MGQWVTRAGIAGVVVTACLLFALDRGVYVGSDRVILGGSCCDSGFLQKRCRYLFVTGIFTVPAPEGQTPLAPLVENVRQRLKAGGFTDAEIAHWVDRQQHLSAAELARSLRVSGDGYCRLFAL